MNQATQRAGAVVSMLAGLIGLIVGFPACCMADGCTAEGGEWIR